MADTPETLVRDALQAHHAIYDHLHCDGRCQRYILAHAPLADTLARGLAAPALVEALTFLATYEKNPPEVMKDDYAYDRLLAFVHEVAIRALAQTPEATDAR